MLELGAHEAEAEEFLRLIAFIELPPPGQLHDLDAAAAAHDVCEIVHCAGSVDYSDRRGLQQANINLTTELLACAQRWRIGRFYFLSSAYSAGFCSGTICEALHAEPSPEDEPNDYTRSKRHAERCVTESGVPFVILRPSVVIGHSRTGIYRGKNYGLYQMWRAIEGILGREYTPVWHTVGPEKVRVNFLHQDALQAGFMAVYNDPNPHPFVHLVSALDACPTMRELCWIWADVYRPVEIYCYDHVADIPLQAIPHRQRRFIEFAWRNLEITGSTWHFDTGYLDRLRAQGHIFADATLASVIACQKRYIAESATIQDYLVRFAELPTGDTRLVGGAPENQGVPTEHS